MRLALVTALLACVLGAAPAVAAPAQELGIVPAGEAKFPERAYVLTLPEGAKVVPDAIRVTENGARPSRLSILSGSEESGAFGVVLVLDASESMRGRSIREAVAAARRLAARRSIGQKLGVVTFNDRPKVLLKPTTDVEAISSALSRQPRLAPQTHLHDAVNAALDQLETAGVTAGSIVALSDGADTGSFLTASAVGQRARRSNVRIFSVGLRSGAFSPSELRALAAAGRGRYTEAASAGQLGRIFEQIGTQLAGEYLIRYRSDATRGTDVRVAVRAKGIPGVAGHLYRAPGLLGGLAEAGSFWTSTFGLLAVSIGCALLVALALGVLLLRLSGRGSSLRERIAGFVAAEETTESASSAALLADRLLGGTERSLEQTRWWEGFKEEVELSRIELPAVRVVYCTVAATLILVSLVTFAIGPLGLVFALGVPLAVRAVIRARVAQQRRAFAEQLPDTLQGVASALRAGHGLVAALAVTVEAAVEPSRREFRRVVADERLGISLEEALVVVQRRMRNRDVQQIALVAEIQRETGGNMAEVLDRITESVRSRMDLRRMVRALTAQGRMSRWVLTALPIVLLAYIVVVDYDYARPLLETGVGRALLLAAGVMLVAGSLVIKRIVDFEV